VNTQNIQPAQARPRPKLVTRKPTGLPPWPMILLAGVEKTGKSFQAARFSGSDLIEQAIYIEIGEGYADHYGAIPGARYEIAVHDGTYASIRDQVIAATEAPRVGDKPTAIIVDSLTILWEMLSKEAQMLANEREQRKNPDGPLVEEAVVTPDLWNRAGERWAAVIDPLRTYDGPVIVTARLELVTVMKGGKPTTEKEWKVKAHKSLPFDADAIVRMPARGRAELTGVRTLELELDPEKPKNLPQFSVDGLLRMLGLDKPGATAPRTYVAPRPQTDRQEASAARKQFMRNLNALLDRKGFVEPPRKGVFLSGVCQRQIRSFDDLTFPEASKAVAVLEQRADVPPAARVQDQVRPVPSPVTAAPLAAAPPPVSQPAPAAEVPMATGPFLKVLHTALSRAGISGKADHLAYCAKRVDRALASTTDLTFAEARSVLKYLEDNPPPALDDQQEEPDPWGPDSRQEQLFENLRCAMQGAATEGALDLVYRQAQEAAASWALDRDDLVELGNVANRCAADLQQARSLHLVAA
jgi:AAA domain